MTDKELLELAAKAAGYAWRGFSSTDTPLLERPTFGPDSDAPVAWNPLTDDGDALGVRGIEQFPNLYNHVPWASELKMYVRQLARAIEQEVRAK